MIRYFYRLEELNFSKLAQVYVESLENDDMCPDPSIDAYGRYLQASQNLYQYLRQVFFRTRGAVYAVLEENSEYVAALRLEPYRDGVLMTAVETQPRYRQMGFAGRLVKDAILYCADHGIAKIYSHVSKRNSPSLALHRACGFTQISDNAAYIDGTVTNRACTFCYQGESK